MDLSRGDIRPIYFRYLSAAFGSAMITSIYSVVDMAMVGQYQGPDGTAALAVVAPIWNVIYSLGMLMGIGGSVLFSTLRGRGEGNRQEENAYFTAATVGSVGLALLAWAVLLLFETPILRFCGADGNMLQLARSYLAPIRLLFPFFLLNQLLAAFLRNDGNPGLATAGVLAGGVFNMVGDYVFVFPMDMGMYGAGLATALGSALTFCVLMTHFKSRKHTLVLQRPTRLFHRLREISVTGFSTFFVDVAMGILTVLFNRQIMKYLGTDALAVYGPIVNVSTFVQCCAYSVGQAAQPLLSVNFGAGQGRRIASVLRYALFTVAGFGIFWTVLSMAVPNLYVRLFMKPTAAILELAPSIIRRYSLSFLLLPLNIFSTYYFQALMKPATAMIVSVFRGCVISGALILLLPTVAGPDAVWFAMPLTELVVAGYAVYHIGKNTRDLTRREGKPA